MNSVIRLLIILLITLKKFLENKTFHINSEIYENKLSSFEYLIFPQLLTQNTIFQI